MAQSRWGESGRQMDVMRTTPRLAARLTTVRTESTAIRAAGGDPGPPADRSQASPWAEREGPVALPKARHSGGPRRSGWPPRRHFHQYGQEHHGHDRSDGRGSGPKQIKQRVRDHVPSSLSTARRLFILNSAPTFRHGVQGHATNRTGATKQGMRPRASSDGGAFQAESNAPDSDWFASLGRGEPGHHGRSSLGGGLSW